MSLAYVETGRALFPVIDVVGTWRGRGAVSFSLAVAPAIDAPVIEAVHRTTDEESARLVTLIDSGALALLEELSESFGLAWTSVAQAAGVSVPAVRKWRLGGTVSNGNMASLASLVLALRELRDLGIEEPGNWLERWVRPDVPVRRVALIRNGDTTVVRALAHDALSAEQALDSCIQNWRERYADAPGRVEFDAAGRPTIILE